jgi:hypothetical protein
MRNGPRRVKPGGTLENAAETIENKAPLPAAFLCLVRGPQGHRDRLKAWPHYLAWQAVALCTDALVAVAGEALDAGEN